MTVVFPIDGGGLDRAGPRTAFWVAGLSIAVAAHAGAVALALRAPRPAPPLPEPAAAVMLELAPEQAAPEAPQTFIADSLNQPDPMVEMETPPPLDTPPPLEPPPDVETPVADTLPEIEPLPELPVSEVAVPRPERRPEVRKVEKAPERKPEKKEEPKREQKAPPTMASQVAAPEKAATARAPESVAGQGASFTPAKWQSKLMAHLERRKRYPGAARARGDEGVAQVRFSIDKAGNVLSAKLVKSSGSAQLDEEVVALVHRASPVPAPPPGAPLTITAPVRFNIR